MTDILKDKIDGLDSTNEVVELSSLIGTNFEQDIDSGELLTAVDNEFEIEDPALNGDQNQEVIWNGEVLNIYPPDYQQSNVVKLQVLSCFVMFIVFGINDQVIGCMMPTLTKEFNTSTVVVSVVFLVQMVGYILASLLNDKIHKIGGKRGAFHFACVLCIVFFGILALKPKSIYIYIICCLPLGFSIGILDASSNVLIGNLLVHKNELMGILHGLYGAAAMCSPPVVTSFVEKGQWHKFFWIPTCMGVAGLLIGIPAFKLETANKYEYEIRCSDTDNENSAASSDPEQNETFLELFKYKAVSLYAAFLFLYLGAEISTGSWLFTYLLSTKSSKRMLMSYVTACFWTGLTAGRFTLGFVTQRYFKNEYRATLFYTRVCVACYAILILVGLINSSSNIYAAAFGFIVFLCGLFIGPLFPNASIVAIQILPKRLHIAGVGAAIAVGGCGGAFLPYVVGLLLHSLGNFLYPFFCTMLTVIMLIVWTAYPRYIKNYDEYL